jgi:hypothetical protein
MVAPFAVERRLRKRDEGFGAERHAVVGVADFIDLEHGARLRASRCGAVSERRISVTDEAKRNSGSGCDLFAGRADPVRTLTPNS